MARKFKRVARKGIGASTVTWPAGQQTLTVEYKPDDDDIPPGLALIVGDNIDASLGQVDVLEVDHKDSDGISGAGSKPVEYYFKDSVKNTLRFGHIKPQVPARVVYRAETAPVADVVFRTSLGPPDALGKAGQIQRHARSRNRRAMRQRFSSAVRRAARKRPHWLKRGARAVLRKLNPLNWLRGDDGQAVGSFTDQEIIIGDAEAEAAADEAMDELMPILLGAFDEFMEGELGREGYDEVYPDDDD